MSMELHVFFRGKLPTKAALTKTMKDLGFPLSVSPATGSLEQQSGFMPMRWRREEAGVEFDVWSGRATVEEIKADGVDPRFDRSANFRWGGEESELLCALCAAAALAKLIDGVVFDPEEDKLQSVDEAIAAARATLQDLTKHEAKKASGTSTADLRRYLKPLLKLRPDLVLVGRMLLVRPIRHLLRGVFFAGRDGTFELPLSVGPVYGSASGDDLRLYVLPHADEPDFEPRLMDVLRHDVFDNVGAVTTLVQHGDRLALEGRRGSVDTADRVISYTLGGDREKAEACIAERGVKTGESEPWQRWAKEQRAFLDRDIASVCAEYHAKEVEAAQAMKLGDAWEPTPFPVELSKSQRVAKSDEQLFATTPWVEVPEGVVGEPPDRGGEVVFGKDWQVRKGRVIVQVPLTREQAQARYDDKQPYCLFTRLKGGELLVLVRSWWPSLRDLQKIPTSYRTEDSQLWVHWDAGHLVALFDERNEKRGMLELSKIDILGGVDPQAFSVFYESDGGAKSVRCRRKEQEDWKPDLPLDNAEVILRWGARPGFADYEELLSRMNASLDINGHRRFE